jgi:ketosteroid isomerase-like protein
MNISNHGSEKANDMVNRIRIAFLLFALLPFHGFAQDKNEHTAVRQTVVDFFETLSTFDDDGLRRCVTHDFILLEDGERWSIDTLIAKVKPMRKVNFKRINKLIFTSLEQKDDLAWTAYDNEAIITVDGKQRTVQWLESAVLRKENGKWKIAMLHSTRIKKNG